MPKATAQKHHQRHIHVMHLVVEIPQYGPGNIHPARTQQCYLSTDANLIIHQHAALLQLNTVIDKYAVDLDSIKLK